MATPAFMVAPALPPLVAPTNAYRIGGIPVPIQTIPQLRLILENAGHALGPGAILKADLVNQICARIQLAVPVPNQAPGNPSRTICPPCQFSTPQAARGEKRATLVEAAAVAAQTSSSFMECFSSLCKHSQAWPQQQ